MNKVVGPILILILCGQSYAQDFPAIGKPCPHFQIHHVQNFSKTVVTNDDFRGRWLMLAFWTSNCSSPIEAMPVMENICREFPEQVVCLRIGENASEAREMYSKLEALYSLASPATFDDDIRRQFGVHYSSHVIVVDPTGIVRAITYKIKRDDMVDLMNGLSVHLPLASNEHEAAQRVEFDFGKLLLLNNNGGPDSVFIQRSLISRWNKEHGSAIMDFVSRQAVINHRFQVVGASLDWLYRLAYGDTTFSFPTTIPGDRTSYGRLSRTVIVEVADRKHFQTNRETGAGFYNYSLAIPTAQTISAGKVQSVMQRDLENVFGYKASVERRKLPVYELIATRKARKKLRTRVDSTVAVYRLDYVMLRNQPVSMLIPALINNIQYGPPVVDRTRIRGNIDITLDAVTVDWNDLERGLRENGLRLRLSKKRLSVVVVRDGDRTKRNVHEWFPRRPSQVCTAQDRDRTKRTKSPRA